LLVTAPAVQQDDQRCPLAPMLWKVNQIRENEIGVELVFVASLLRRDCARECECEQD
jgi:hypothetical protein